MTKTLLALSLICLVSGLVVSGGVRVQADWVYVLLPAGAICFGLFLISKMLEKESAAYDAEQQQAGAAAAHRSAGKSTGRDGSCGCGGAASRDQDTQSATGGPYSTPHHG